jgi:YHS domain-containing protein
MKEKVCPLCSKPVRSDALIKEYCKLCGMIVDDSELQFIYDAPTGDSFYFCCEKCMKTYINTYCKEKMENMVITLEAIIEDLSVELDGEGILTISRKTVQEITYLPKVQVPELEM